MGDEEKFTAEELAILGEAPAEEPQGDPATPAEEAAPAEEKPAETPSADEKDAAGGEAKPAEAESAEQTKAEQEVAEKMGLRVEGGFIIDDEGTKIPAQRWRKIYHDYKEATRQAAEAVAGKAEIEQKYKLFRELGPEKYFSIYPAEAPQGGYQKPATPAAAQRQEVDPLDLRAQYPDPSNQFHGMTLREIYQIDAGEARRLERAWERSHQREVSDVEEARRRALREAEDEINRFTGDMAREMFGKDAQAMTKDEEANVGKVVQDTIDFMQRTGRGGGNIADAYFIMNRDSILADAKQKAGKAALQALKAPSIPSIGGAGRPASAAASKYDEMTADQLAAEVSGMDDAAVMKFLKSAPEALRAKHPGIPWM